jgi:hypothetical protein
MRLKPHELQPATQLCHHVQLRIPRAAERGVVALALRVVFPPVDMHQARLLEAGHPVRHQIVETQVAYLQPRDLVDAQAPSVATLVSSRKPSAAIVSSRHASNQCTVASLHIDGER